MPNAATPYTFASCATGNEEFVVTTEQSSEPAGAPANAEADATPPPTARQPLWVRLLGSGWIPAAAVAVFAVTVLVAFETPVWDIARFAAYVIFCLTLPGTLLWRSLRGTPRSFVEDVAAGTVLAYAVELFTYFLASAAGVPRLVAAWPAVVVVVFLAVPKLRRHWRPTDTPRMPIGWSWSIAAMSAFTLFWLAWLGFRNHALDGPTSGSPYVDVPFHLALVGELRHHFPPKTPWVTGEPVSYHWFVHGHMAAASWVTGIDARLILLRLFAVPLAILTVVLTAVLAGRVAKRVWAGPVAVALYVVVGSFTPYAWSWFSPPYTDTSLLKAALTGSPTQTYGLTIFLAAILLAVDRLRREPGGRGQWVMLTLLIAATIGGKATFLPLLLGGVGLAGLISLIVRRKIELPLVAIGALGLAGFAYAQFVLFGGVSQGLTIEPFAMLPIVAGASTAPTWFLTLTFGLVMLSWSGRGAGILGLLARRERWTDPVASLLMGIIVAALIVTFTVHQSGGAEMYFTLSVTPFIAVLSAWGASQLLPPERATRRTVAALLGMAVAGAVVTAAVALLGRQVAPTPELLGSWRAQAIALVTPYLIVLTFVAAVAIALLILRRRYTALRGISAVLVLAFVFGLGASRMVPAVRDPARHVEAFGGLGYIKADAGGRPIAPGGPEAARWLRDHSGTDDLIATNVHCRWEYKGNCDHRHFWIAALAERHVLVESWGYTATVNQKIPSYEGPWYYVPYWRPDVLADNDRVFTEPTQANADRLREKYGVRWLFVDERFHPPAPGLDKVAEERFRQGDSVVYELVG